MKKKDLLIVIIFIAFLVGPTILFWFVKDKMDLTNYENRVLYSKPEFSFKNIVEFPMNYENYMNDNLPFKNELRNVRAKILYKVFDTSSNTKVIVGKDGWLFYNGIANNDGNPILDYRNISSYTEEVRQDIVDNLKKTESELKKKKIDFYVYVAPNKENVYSDYMPSSITRSDREESKTEELVKYLKENTNLNVIYPKDILVDNREVCNTYCKYDTHWNNYGAYLGTVELMKKIDSKFKSPEIKITTEKQGGDLLGMNSLYHGIENDEPVINGFYDNIEYTCKEDGEFKECKSKNPVYNKTILIVGDSFRNATVQYIAKLYSQSIFVHRGYYAEDYVKKYKPDIVVYGTVERSSGSLANCTKIIENN